MPGKPAGLTRAPSTDGSVRGSAPGTMMRRRSRPAARSVRAGPRNARNDRGGSSGRSASGHLRRLATKVVGTGALALSLALAPPTGASEAEGNDRTGRVVPGYAFEFPRDHFAHPAFDSEWWYYTGNLETGSGRHFGFELTFFRKARAIDRVEPSAWDLDQFWLAHFTITDTREERFFVAERANRTGPGIAGAQVGERRIWNGNWSVEWRPGDEVRPTQVLTAMSRSASLRLALVPGKPAVIQGRDGVSRKAAEDPRAVSHYLSFTRMAATGTITVEGEAFAVTGLAWMDHEFFADYPIEGKVGWDWVSIQLDDGTDLMAFGIRDARGHHGPDTTGTFVDADGVPLPIEFRGVALRPGRRWRSESTDAQYPVEWEVEVPGLGLRLDVRPRIDGQEVFTEGGIMPVYWEGAVRVAGERRGRPVTGVGYLEMTGYREKLDIAGIGDARTGERSGASR